MKIVLCKKCEKPLIEDIRKCGKCEICEYKKDCIGPNTLCTACLEKVDSCKTDFNKKEKKESCLLCKKTYKKGENKIERCHDCYGQKSCMLLEIFCSDCINKVHTNKESIKDLLIDLNPIQRREFSEKFMELFTNKRVERILDMLSEMLSDFFRRGSDEDLPPFMKF